MGQGADVEKKSQIDYRSVTTSFFQKMPTVWNTCLPGGPHGALGNMETSPASAVRSGREWVKAEE